MTSSSEPEKKYMTLTCGGKSALTYLTKYGITEEEATEILRMSRREVEYQTVKKAVDRARDLAYEKLSPWEKMKQAWERKLKNLEWSIGGE